MGLRVDVPPSTPEFGQKICDLVAERVPVAEICARAGMPNKDTLYRWKREIPQFSNNYAREREHRADARQDYIDEITRKLVAGSIDAQTARVIIDAEKWQMGKEQPKKYGDRISTELTGKDGKPLFEDRPEDNLATARWIALILSEADEKLKDKAEGGS